METWVDMISMSVTLALEVGEGAEAGRPLELSGQPA